MTAEFTHRLAVAGDIPLLTALMERSIAELQTAVLTPPQVAASRAIMGLDTQLIEDGTYFVVEQRVDGAAVMAGCGGWSWRATVYGGDHSSGRDAAPLDPATDPARVRAMYTDPAFARRGVGRLILKLCEEAAMERGFRRARLAATLSGEPLYRAAGYDVMERFEDDRGGAPVPLSRMEKALAGASPGAAPGKLLTPAARRALDEAALRRAAATAAQADLESGGPKGLEPTRFGDWERKGLAVDF